MSDPIQTTRAALSGIKEAVKVGREIKETATEVNQMIEAHTDSMANELVSEIADYLEAN